MQKAFESHCWKQLIRFNYQRTADYSIFLKWSGMTCGGGVMPGILTLREGKEHPRGERSKLRRWRVAKQVKEKHPITPNMPLIKYKNLYPKHNAWLTQPVAPVLFQCPLPWVYPAISANPLHWFSTPIRNRRNLYIKDSLWVIGSIFKWYQVLVINDLWTALFAGGKRNFHPVRTCWFDFNIYNNCAS